MAGKVLHIVWGFKLGGIETMLVNIINEQVARGVEATLVIINDIVEESLIARLDNRIKVVRIKRYAKSRNPWPIFKLNLIIWRAKGHTIHCHSHTILNYLLPSLRRRCAVTIHNTRVVKEASALRQCAKVFAISKAVNKELSDNFGIESTIIYNGIDFSKISPRTEFDTNHSGIKLLQLGRLSEQKGHYISIGAMALLREQNISLDIIGDGELRSKLEEQIAENKLEGKVRLLGARNQEYIFSNLKEYDALLQPSIFEGFGLVAVEAMAAKIPVIASDIDGLTEVLDKGRYGICFKSGDVAECAKAIGQFCAEPYDEGRLNEIYDYAQSNFDVKKTAEKYLNEYAKL